MVSEKPEKKPGRFGLGNLFGGHPKQQSSSEDEDGRSGPPTWSMGVLNDPKTVEVPGMWALSSTFANTMLIPFQALFFFLLLTAMSH